jgi:hypothetical protein
MTTAPDLSTLEAHTPHSIVRFDGWQQTIANEREVQKALLKYQLHRDQELFDKARHQAVLLSGDGVYPRGVRCTFSK